MRILDNIVKTSNTKSDIIKNSKQSGFSICGVGNDRVAINIGNNRIAKIDPFQKQNKIEYELQCNEYRNYFCPITEYSTSFSWIICKKATESELSEKREFVQAFISNTGMIPKDIEIDDIGKVDGVCKFIDYGYGLQQVDENYSLTTFTIDENPN